MPHEEYVLAVENFRGHRVKSLVQTQDRETGDVEVFRKNMFWKWKRNVDWVLYVSSKDI